jgi:hypothetical protein
MGPLCISEPEFGHYDQEIWCFSQFLSQTRVFSKKELKFDFFFNTYKVIPEAIMCNSSRIWDLRLRNAEFQPVLTAN